MGALILVADDDRISARVIETSLLRAGHRVLLAQDGVEASRMVLKHHPDLVISDWMMPGLDGLGLLKFIQEQESVPYYILLTVRARSQDRVAGLDAGADDYLIKPFEADELQARVRAGLRIIALRRSLERTVQQLAEKARILEDDLKAASRAQRDMLPQNLPRLAGLEFQYRFVPCHYVSGDSLNVFRLSEDHLGFYMLDVCGHGVQAVMLSVSIHRVLTPELNLNSPLKRPLLDPPYFRISTPREVIETLNRDHGSTPVTEFFTFFYGVLHLKTREMVYSRAGHLPPLLLRADGSLRSLREGGMPIGIEETAAWEEGRLTLQEGDRLVVYSDGVVDVRNADRQAWGVDGLESYLPSLAALELEPALEQVEQKARDWSHPEGFPDDFSLLALQVGAISPD